MSGVSLLYTANSLVGLTVSQVAVLATVSGTFPVMAMKAQTRANGGFLFIATGMWGYTELTKSHDLRLNQQFQWRANLWGAWRLGHYHSVLSMLASRVFKLDWHNFDKWYKM